MFVKGLQCSLVPRPFSTVPPFYREHVGGTPYKMAERQRRVWVREWLQCVSVTSLNAIFHCYISEHSLYASGTARIHAPILT